MTSYKAYMVLRMAVTTQTNEIETVGFSDFIDCINDIQWAFDRYYSLVAEIVLNIYYYQGFPYLTLINVYKMFPFNNLNL